MRYILSGGTTGTVTTTSCQVITYRRDGVTSTATSDVVVLYKVTVYPSYESASTFVQGAPVDGFPTAQERNRLAAIEGCLAQRVVHSRIPKRALLLRSNYQGMARLPCYRGTRIR